MRRSVENAEPFMTVRRTMRTNWPLKKAISSWWSTKTPKTKIGWKVVWWQIRANVDFSQSPLFICWTMSHLDDLLIFTFSCFLINSFPFPIQSKNLMTVPSSTFLFYVSWWYDKEYIQCNKDVLHLPVFCCVHLYKGIVLDSCWTPKGTCFLKASFKKQVTRPTTSWRHYSIGPAPI